MSSEKEILLVVLVAGGLAAILVYVVLRARYAQNKLKVLNKLLKDQGVEIRRKNRMLLEQNHKLKLLDEEKNNIISIVSHDLKSPLNKIFALVSLMSMAKENLDDDQKEYLGKINHVIKDGLELIRNLLDIRALESGGIELNLSEVKAKELTKSVVRSFQSPAAHKMILVHFKEEEEFRLITDRQYLTRIIENLMSNALKFSPKETIVSVSLKKADGHYLLEIKDQGPGLIEEELPLLFHKFQVLSARPTGGESSSGLGLSITKSLVEGLGGDISYAPANGNGAIFSVALPLNGPNHQNKNHHSPQ